MQYPVPQFTDVEDRIIGPLTVKQFGIVFAGGVLIFLAYSATKSLGVLIVFGLLIGLPTLIVAFAKLNGRPMYNTFPVIARFLTSDKSLVFHREVYGTGKSSKISELKVKEQVAQPVVNAEEKLLEVNTLLEKQAQEEEQLIKKV